ncbi:MAG: hypothetical protein EOP83_21425 [Verrucomicrobiaceae bacterium]|nr:MAG: hypothetical protein EOP83_21425 [Verrucomicrobiaceae bacterium]
MSQDKMHYEIDEERAVIGTALLSFQHAALGQKHYEVAVRHQQRLVMNENGAVLEWLTEHLPDTKVEWIRAEDYTDTKSVDSLIASLIHKRKKPVNLPVEKYETHCLVAWFDSPTAATLFKLHWG